MCVNWLHATELDVSEGESVVGIDEPSEAQVEKLLLDNLSSSDDDGELVQKPLKKKRYVGMCIIYTMHLTTL